MVDNLVVGGVQVREDEALINVTWAGQNGEMAQPVSWTAADGDIKQYVAEAIRSGSVRNIPADPAVNLQNFVVERFAATAEIPINRVFLRPKTPFGA